MGAAGPAGSSAINAAKGAATTSGGGARVSESSWPQSAQVCAVRTQICIQVAAASSSSGETASARGAQMGQGACAAVSSLSGWT